MNNRLIFKETPPLEAIKRHARLFFDNAGFNEGKAYEEARGAVNYIRHALTNYDALRYEIRVDKLYENENPDILALKLTALVAIRNKWPEFRTECLRQEDWLNSRAASLEYGRRKYNVMTAAPASLPLAPALDLIGAGRPTESETAAANPVPVAAKEPDGSEIAFFKELVEELENKLAAKEGELAAARQEITAMRNTALGTLFDELAALRARGTESDALRTEKEALRTENAGYLRILRAVRAALGAEIGGAPAPSGETPAEVIPPLAATTKGELVPKAKRRSPIYKTPEAKARAVESARRNAEKARLAHINQALARRAALAGLTPAEAAKVEEAAKALKRHRHLAPGSREVFAINAAKARAGRQAKIAARRAAALKAE
jgi:hypothetical protein